MVFKVILETNMNCLENYINNEYVTKFPDNIGHYTFQQTHFIEKKLSLAINISCRALQLSMKV